LVLLYGSGLNFALEEDQETPPEGRSLNLAGGNQI
jgi:hypothetical protein